jgi:anti-sigma28 factor (negative regulator of flagellin synthesis)
MTGWTPKHGARRPERILALKAKIERGEYQVPPERVADAIMAWYRRIDPPSRR